ncbi:MAG TPA: hypothetical protein VGG41_20795 [Solirubrobacteraceae bacterium]|jgi:hypothetical protein
MRLHSVNVRTVLGCVLAAAAIGPTTALARFELNPVGPTGGEASTAGREVSQTRFARDDRRLLFIRIEDQIRLVSYGAAPMVELGPNALRIYRAGGLSAAEPDAQAVKFAASGSLLTGRAG